MSLLDTLKIDKTVFSTASLHDDSGEADYWRTQSHLFAERRRDLVTFLRSCAPDDWSHTANRPEIGTLTVESQALLIPLHDTYHLRQIAEWRGGFAR